MIRLSGFVLIVVVALFALTLPASADGPAEGRAGRAEMRFLEGMIDHHQMALDMATDCVARAASEVVRDLCQNVIDAQSAEIALMQGWLLEWYNVDYTPMSMMSGEMGGMMGMEHGGHAMGDAPAMDPPMMMGMMAGLNRLDGVDYDVAWLEAMADHHDDALHMSERVLRWAEHDAIRQLAVEIIRAQSAEIRQIETLILELGAE